jgi:hypothetical protein
MQITSFIGMDVYRATISISIAEDGRNGPVRFLGVISNAPEEIAKMAKRLSATGSSISVTKPEDAGTTSIASSRRLAIGVWSWRSR